MYNEFQTHRKADTVKWVVAFVLIAALLLGVVASLYMSLRPEDTPTDTEQTESTNTNDTTNGTDNETEGDHTDILPTSSDITVLDADVLTQDGTDMESGQVYRMASSMTFTTPTAYSETASEGVTIEAILSPENATDKRVYWSVSFASDTEWTEGKEANDYISVTPLSEGSNIATVECLQPFATPIEIRVFSYNNVYIRTKCVVHYRAKVSSIAVTADSVANNIASGSLVFYNSAYNDSVYAGYRETVYIDPLNEVTIAPTYEVTPTTATIGAADITSLPETGHVDIGMMWDVGIMAEMEAIGYTFTDINAVVYLNGGKNDGTEQSVSGAGGFLAKIIELLSLSTNYAELGSIEQEEMLSYVLTYDSGPAFFLYCAYTTETDTEVDQPLDTFVEVYINPAVLSIEVSPERIEF